MNNINSHKLHSPCAIYNTDTHNFGVWMGVILEFCKEKKKGFLMPAWFLPGTDLVS